MADLSIITTLNSTEKSQIAKLMHQKAVEQTDWPVNDWEYFYDLITNYSEDVGMVLVLVTTENDSGEIACGYSRLEYRLNPDNDRTMSELELYVLPKFRQKGIGKTLLKTIIHSLLPKQIETVVLRTLEEHPINQVIQQKLSVTPTFTNNINLLQIEITMRELLNSTINQKIERFQKLGYTFYQLNDDNYPLDDENYADLMEEIWNENIGMNTQRSVERFPVSRLNGRYEYVKNQGGTIYTVAVRDRVENWVGLTEIFVYKSNPKIGNQSMTGVRKIHRGNGLGLMLKALNLVFVLEQTEISHVITYNANLNAGIQKINKNLGFKSSVTSLVYEIPVTLLQKSLN